MHYHTKWYGQAFESGGVFHLLFHVQAVAQRETVDINTLEDKMGRPLTEDERSRIGVSRLRLFLEHLLQQR